MQNDGEAPEPIGQRTRHFALRVIRLVRVLQGDSVGRVLAAQLLRAGTSIGAIVHEAQGAQSRADFVAKMSIAQKEAHETLYWLQVIEDAALIPSERMSDIIEETEQLLKILSAILVSAKRTKKP
jgi:four helix bundle protein